LWSWAGSLVNPLNDGISGTATGIFALDTVATISGVRKKILEWHVCVVSKL
jgi:hypothetical protein